MGTQRSSTHGVDIRIAFVPAFPNTRISRELLYGTTNEFVSKRDKTLLTPASNSLVASRDFGGSLNWIHVWVHTSTTFQPSMLTATSCSCHCSRLPTRMRGLTGHRLRGAVSEPADACGEARHVARRKRVDPSKGAESGSTLVYRRLQPSSARRSVIPAHFTRGGASTQPSERPPVLMVELVVVPSVLTVGTMAACLMFSLAGHPLAHGGHEAPT